MLFDLSNNKVSRISLCGFEIANVTGRYDADIKIE